MMRSSGLQWTLLVVALVLYAWIPGWTAWHAINSNDFKHIYLGMMALLDGTSPYSLQALHHQAALQGYRQISLNPYVYLPFTGQVLFFLAPLKLHQAVAIWFFLNHLFVAGSVWILSKMFSQWRIGATAVMIISLAFSMPLFRTLTAGQLNLALLFLLCLAWQQIHRGRHGSSGAIMAFAALFKLAPGLYGVYFMLRRQWRAAATMATTGLALILISIVFAGPEIYLEFFPVLQQMGYGRSTWPQFFSFWDDPPNQSLNSFFTHILAANDHTTPWLAAGQPLANFWTTVVTAGLILAYVAFCLRIRPQYGNPPKLTAADDAAWCSTLILALLIPSLMWDHYLVMLIMPVAWMIQAAIRFRWYVALTVIILCYLATCLPWNFEAMPWRQGMGIVFMSFKLWPTLILFGLGLCFVMWSGKGFPAAEACAPGTAKINPLEPENTCRL